MPQSIAETVKALAEFETELDKVKETAQETKKKLVKDARDWAEAAKGSALAEAQRVASDLLSEARTEAEAEAEKIRSKGEAATAKFSDAISKHKKAASELVLSRLLGEGQ